MAFSDPIRPDRDLEGWQVIIDGRTIQLKDMTKDELLTALADMMEILEGVEEEAAKAVAGMNSLMTVYRNGKSKRPVVDGS